jgi:hypothetical protein
MEPAEDEGHSKVRPDVANVLTEDQGVCPICSHPMSEHTIERSQRNTVLHCPVATEPRQESYEPLNEVGQAKHATRSPI